MAPKIDDRYLRDVRAEAGDRVKLMASFTGEPQPEIEWIKGGKAVAASSANSVTLVNTDDSTKLIFNNIAKSQEGSYTLRAVNSSGEQTVTVNISVRDRPSPPTDLSAVPNGESAASLAWKVPADDGGAHIDYYQVERWESGKEGWLACGRSKANTFEALGLITGKVYKFRVSAVNRYGYSDPADSSEMEK